MRDVLLPTPLRGEIWWVDLDPIAGHEQSGKRPALVVSADTFNQGSRRLAVILPMTTAQRTYRLHIWAEPADTGLKRPGAIMCDQIRTISLTRFLDTYPAGRASPSMMVLVERRLRALLAFPLIT